MISVGYLGDGSYDHRELPKRGIGALGVIELLAHVPKKPLDIGIHVVDVGALPVVSGVLARCMLLQRGGRGREPVDEIGSTTFTIQKLARVGQLGLDRTGFS